MIITIRFIWQSWWRRKERFILLLIGALIISVGLTYLVGLSETNEATVVNELQQRWSSSYDIVVRPEGTRANTEKDSLLDPNFLSGINGGISMEEYETIKGISHVDIAAPIAMIAEVFYTVELAELPTENGIYRLVLDEYMGIVCFLYLTAWRVCIYDNTDCSIFLGRKYGGTKNTRKKCLLVFYYALLPPVLL